MTGAVALLQQYAKHQIANATPGWDADARNHLVMKAVLMNSADKLKDPGDGSVLGMTKTITKKAGITKSWLTSKALDIPANPGGKKIPLDEEMGAGQLNVNRALTQFKGGETDANQWAPWPVPPGAPAPAIGWDADTLNGVAVNKYYLGNLKGGTFVSVTLTWDRHVGLFEALGGNGQYDPNLGEFFLSSPLKDLDLWLVPRGMGQGRPTAVWSSVSLVDNVEHFFFALPAQGGEYELWVDQWTPDVSTPYAVAWWTVQIPPPPPPLPHGIAGRIWDDANGNGVQNLGEEGVALARVDLFDSTDAWIATTTTDEYGNYSFDLADYGWYYVAVTNPVDTGFTAPNVDPDTLDSDVDATGRTALFEVNSADYVADAGLISVPFATIGNHVWDDLDRDGIQDAGEPGLADVAVYLYDDADHLMDVTYTDESGDYQFSDVEPGTYYVVFEAPFAYAFTAQDTGSNDAADSDADSTGRTAVFAVSSGAAVTTLDAGFVRMYYVSGRTWEDSDGDGLQEEDELPLSDVTVRLLDDNGIEVASTQTDEYGEYFFADLDPGDYRVEFALPSGHHFSPSDVGSDDALDSDADPATGRTALVTLGAGEDAYYVDAGLTPLGSISGRVWDDLNYNGIREGGEPVHTDVFVQLLDSSSTVIATTITDANGEYGFTDLSPGDYYIRFVQPPGYLYFTLRDQGADDTLDSDPDPYTGQTTLLTLASGSEISSVDAGLALARITGRVWNDADADGIEEVGEAGVAGVLVRLYDSFGFLTATTMTGADGSYSFTVASPGQYRVQFEPDAGWNFSAADQGSDDSVDSDVTSPWDGSTDLFWIALGDLKTDLDAGIHV